MDGALLRCLHSKLSRSETRLVYPDRLISGPSPAPCRCPPPVFFELLVLISNHSSNLHMSFSRTARTNRDGTTPYEVHGVPSPDLVVGKIFGSFQFDTERHRKRLANPRHTESSCFMIASSLSCRISAYLPDVKSPCPTSWQAEGPSANHSDMPLSIESYAGGPSPARRPRPGLFPVSCMGVRLQRSLRD